MKTKLEIFEKLYQDVETQGCEYALRRSSWKALEDDELNALMETLDETIDEIEQRVYDMSQEFSTEKV